MSFISQSMLNRFPDWSKVKRDSSSNFAILLDCIGNELDLLMEQKVSLESQRKNLLSYPLYEVESLNKFSLIEDPSLPSRFKDLIIKNISLTAAQGPLALYTSWQKYCFALSDSFAVSSEFKAFEKQLFTNSLEDSIVLNNPSKLYFNLEGVASFKTARIDYNEDVQRTQGGEEHNYYRIIVRGLDGAGKEIEETLSVNDLRIYETKEKFKVVKSLFPTNGFYNRNPVVGGPAIEIFGLNLFGEISSLEKSYITISNMPFAKMRSKLKTIEGTVSANPFLGTPYESHSSIQNNIFAELSNIKIDDQDRSFLAYIHKYFTDEKNTLTEDSKLDSKFFEEEYCKVELLTDAGDSYLATGWAHDLKRNTICTIGADKSLRVYEIVKPKIVRSNDIVESKEVAINIDINRNTLTVGEEYTVNILLERPKGDIYKYYIFKSIPPEGIAESWKALFLNSDDTWVEMLTGFEGNNFEDDFENIKPGVSIIETAEETGQVDYYVCSIQNNIEFDDSMETFRNKINALVLKNNTGIHVNKCSVLVANQTPLKTFDLSSEVSGIECSIHIQGIKNNLYVQDDDTVKVFEEVSDKAFFIQEAAAVYTEKTYVEPLIFTAKFSDNTTYKVECNYGD
mgnify:CR=1 FL=1|jgi:hypothetical protein